MMSKDQFEKAEAFLILKYGSLEKAINHWINLPEDGGHEMDDFDMLEVFLAQPAKRTGNMTKVIANFKSESGDGYYIPPAIYDAEVKAYRAAVNSMHQRRLHDISSYWL